MSRQREQRLQAIYDAFDARNYKGAIKLSNAAIQKYPQQPVFKSLKAVALDRSGKTEEALQLVDEVLALAPADDHVLHMLLLVLKPAKRAGDLHKAYEAACSKDPSNVELLQGLFGCHVRSFNFQSQQQVAMKLNKLHPNELYQWWVITSLALQCHEAAAAAAIAGHNSDSSDNKAQGAISAVPAAGMGADKLLQLAEAMAARLLSKHTGCCPPSWESVMMYLGFLQAQGKHDAALGALRGNLAKAFSLAAERREAEAALLLAKGDLLAAAALYEEGLMEQPDDWALLLLYLDCLLPGAACTLPAISSTAVAQMLVGVEASTTPGFLMGGLQALVATMTTGEPVSLSVEDRVKKAAVFITSLPATATADEVTNNNNSDEQEDDDPAASSGSAKVAPLLRGPALAVVELVKRRLQLGLATQQDLAEAVLQYHDRLGHVVSCAMDVSTYLPFITGAVRTALGEQLAQQAEMAAADYEQQQQQQLQQGSSSNEMLLKLLRRQMAARQTQADLGGPTFTSVAAAQQHAQQLLQLYASYLPLYEGLDERERGPADELLWLAAAALMQAAALAQQADSAESSSSGLGYMLQALLVLEAAAMGRPYCAPVRLGLTGLHGLLGNPKAAATHFFMLDVKHVQHDTLSSHHLLPVLLGLSVAEGAEEVLGATLRLFEDHINGDAGESLMQAFERGSHTKVLEFVCFKERLQRSHSYALARAEHAILSLATAAANSVEAAATTAYAAVAELPLALLDSVDWQGMRFNDDLTTRVPWLPPIAGARHLQLLLWWEQQQRQGSNSSISRNGSTSISSEQNAFWWKQVSAAEADNQPAVQFRAALQAAAKQRWLQPHLLAAALQASGPQRSSADAAQQLPQLLQRYAGSVCSSLGALQLEVQQCFGKQQPSLGSEVAVSRQLQLLDAALFLLAEHVQTLLAAAETDVAADGSTAAVCTSISDCASLVASGLQQLQLQVCRQLQPAKAYLGSMLPGHVLSAAVLLVSESCTWITSCLEAWSKIIKQVRTRRKTKNDTSTTATTGLLQHTVVQPALLGLGAIQTALDSCLQALSTSCANFLDVEQATMEALVLAQYNPSSNPDVLVLVGWEQRLSVQHVLIDALTSQRQLIEQVNVSAEKLGGRARHLSW